jgi:hypothetical protein
MNITGQNHSGFNIFDGNLSHTFPLQAQNSF